MVEIVSMERELGRLEGRVESLEKQVSSDRHDVQRQLTEIKTELKAEMEKKFDKSEADQKLAREKLDELLLRFTELASDLKNRDEQHNNQIESQREQVKVGWTVAKVIWAVVAGAVSLGATIAGLFHWKV